MSAPTLIAPLRLVETPAEPDSSDDRLPAEIHPLVLRYCRGRLGALTGSASDIAERAYQAVVDAMPRFSITGGSLRGFACAVAAGVVTDAIREESHDPVARRTVPATAELADLLHRLSTHHREVLVLRIVVGLTADETADALGITAASVRVTQHLALNRLRALRAQA